MLRQFSTLPGLLLGLICLASAAGLRADQSAISSWEQNARYPVVSRDRCATHYRLPDGTFRALITIRPHNYLGADGVWRPIDESLREGIEYAYENLENGLTSRYPRSLSDGVMFAGQSEPALVQHARAFRAFNADGVAVLERLPGRALARQHDRGTVHYPHVFPGITDEYVTGPDRVKHSLVLEQHALHGVPADGWVTGEFSLQVPQGLNLARTAHGRTVRLVNAEGVALYEFGPVFAVDAHGEQVDGILEATLEEGVLVLGMRAPAAWLLDESRAWPVRIDPTLALQPDGVAGKDTMVRDGATGTNYGTNANLSSNYAGNVTLESMIEFDLGSMPAGATITAAQFEVWHRSNTTTGHVWEIHEFTQAWVESTVNWGNKPPVSPTLVTTLTHTVGSPSVWRIHTGMGAVAAAWYATPASNLGFRLKNMTNLNGYAYFRSSDDSIALERPIFRVDYSTQPPAVTGVTPGTVNWGGLLTITGTDLGGATVTIGNVAQVINTASPTQIELFVSDLTPTGPNQVVAVTTSSGSDTTQTVTVNAVAPTLSGGTPNPVQWGQVLTINGNFLSQASVVTIGAMPQVITSQNATSIQLTVDAATPMGLQTVAVTNPAGTTSNLQVTVDGVLPTITTATPTSVDWLATLTIDGTWLSNATQVTIGAVPQTIVTNTANQIEVTVSASTPTGLQDVVVTTAVGASAAVQVTVNSVVPQVTMVAPNPVQWLQTLTLQGSYFVNVSSVTVGGVTQAILSSTPSQIEITVADNTPLGNQPIVVTTAVGVDNSQSVQVQGVVPGVTGAAPNPVEWNQALIISGNFLATTSLVTIGGVPQAIIDATTTQIEVLVDYSTPIGLQVIEVTTGGGVSNTAMVTVNATPPTINSATPDPVAWYQTLVITGGGFASLVSITLGGETMTPTTSSPTQIEAPVPATVAPGLQTLEITTAGGTDSVQVTVEGAPPVVTSVSPATVLKGQAVTITGTGLANATVTIGGVAALVTSNTMTEIVATVAGSTPEGTQPVSVTTAFGTHASQSVSVTAPVSSGGGGGGGGGCVGGAGTALPLLLLAMYRRRRK